MIDEWYSYGVFGHTEDQTLWALQNWEFFEEGVWPPEPNEYLTDEYSGKKWVKVFKKKSTAIDAPIQKRQIKTSASFTKPKEIAAEISQRLRKTGVDGKLLVAEVQGGKTFELSKESQDALMYIKGWRRKRTPYNQWKASRCYYRKLRGS